MARTKSNTLERRLSGKMIRDRGRIKWTAMMLPEHVELLRDWVAEDGYEQEKDLDEQQWERINSVLVEAIQLEKDVTITYFQNHRYEIISGRIQRWNELEQKLMIYDSSDQLHPICVKQIYDARIGGNEKE